MHQTHPHQITHMHLFLLAHRWFPWPCKQICLQSYWEDVVNAMVYNSIFDGSSQFEIQRLKEILRSFFDWNILKNIYR